MIGNEESLFITKADPYFSVSEWSAFALREETKRISENFTYSNGIKPQDSEILNELLQAFTQAIATAHGVTIAGRTYSFLHSQGYYIETDEDLMSVREAACEIWLQQIMTLTLMRLSLLPLDSQLPMTELEIDNVNLDALTQQLTGKKTNE